MKVQVGAYSFRNLDELYKVLGRMVTAREAKVTLVEDFDRIELLEETLSDKSKVLSVRFGSARASGA